MKQFPLAVLITIILLSACAPSEQSIQTALAETLAANPTATVTPSSTPTITPTATFTKTKRPTNTPTKTATSTPEPLTATAQFMQDQATKKAAAVTATAQEKSAYATRTAVYKSIYATKIAGYKPIDLKEFLTYPGSHVGEKVIVRGRVFNINGNVVQIFVGRFDAIYVEMNQPVSGIYEDDTITVYGTVYGSKCFTNTMGNQVCQPALYLAWFEKK